MRPARIRNIVMFSKKMFFICLILSCLSFSIVSAKSFGVIVFNNGDLWIGNFRNGMKKGIGLYLMYNGEWETLNFKDDSYDVISSSTNYRI